LKILYYLYIKFFKAHTFDSSRNLWTVRRNMEQPFIQPLRLSMNIRLTILRNVAPHFSYHYFT